MRTERWLIGGLALSVVVNLLLVGFILGRLSGFVPPPVFAPDPTAGFFRKLGFLSDERREAVLPDARKALREMMPTFRKVRSDQHAVFDALAADPFEPAALETALAGLRADLTAAEIASHQAFVDLAKRMTTAERKEFVQALRRPHPHGGGASEGRQHPPLGMHPGGGGKEPPQEDR